MIFTTLNNFGTGKEEPKRQRWLMLASILLKASSLLSCLYKSFIKKQFTYHNAMKMTAEGWPMEQRFFSVFSSVFSEGSFSFLYCIILDDLRMFSLPSAALLPPGNGLQESSSQPHSLNILAQNY